MSKAHEIFIAGMKNEKIFEVAKAYISRVYDEVEKYENCRMLSYHIALNLKNLIPHNRKIVSSRTEREGGMFQFILHCSFKMYL